MKTIATVLLLASTASAVTISMNGDVTYDGPDAPPGGPWNGSLLAAFNDEHDALSIQFSSDSPSGNTNAILDWGLLDETTKRFYEDDTGAHQLALITSGDWNDGQPLTDATFADRVDRIEYSWFDEQLNQLGNFQTSLALSPPEYQVIAVPEPTTKWILVVAVLMLGYCARRGLPLRLMAIIMPVMAIAIGGGRFF